MTSSRTLLNSFLLCIGISLSAGTALADIDSARLAMENTAHPLLQVGTSRGNFYIELLPEEAPNNVAHVMALAAGEVEIMEPATNISLRPRYYDGMRFHRVLPGFLIQAASPAYHPLGAPGSPLNDEINANALGLDRALVLNPDGSFNAMLNITSKADFETDILLPLYANMGIDSVTALKNRQGEVLQALQQLSVKRAYENQGYRYRTGAPSRPIGRGTVALANHGPNTNGAEFFISLTDADWLTGKYTVIGRVVDGLDIVSAIGEIAIDPLRFSRQSTVIYSIDRVD